MLKLSHLSYIFIAILVTGCLEFELQTIIDTTEESNNDTVLSGQLSDSFIKGLSYTAYPSGLTGITDTFGTFNYKAGDRVSFSINTVEFPPLDPSADHVFYDIYDLTGEPVSTSADHAPNTANIALLLQTLDHDKDESNGIDLTDIVAGLQGSPNLNNTVRFGFGEGDTDTLINILSDFNLNETDIEVTLNEAINALNSASQKKQTIGLKIKGYIIEGNEIGQERIVESESDFAYIPIQGYDFAQIENMPLILGYQPHIDFNDISSYQQNLINGSYTRTLINFKLEGNNLVPSTIFPDAYSSLLPVRGNAGSYSVITESGVNKLHIALEEEWEGGAVSCRSQVLTPIQGVSSIVSIVSVLIQEYDNPACDTVAGENALGEPMSIYVGEMARIEPPSPALLDFSNGQARFTHQELSTTPFAINPAYQLFGKTDRGRLTPGLYHVEIGNLLLENALSLVVARVNLQTYQVIGDPQLILVDGMVSLNLGTNETIMVLLSTQAWNTFHQASFDLTISQ